MCSLCAENYHLITKSFHIYIFVTINIWSLKNCCVLYRQWCYHHGRSARIGDDFLPRTSLGCLIRSQQTLERLLRRLSDQFVFISPSSTIPVLFTSCRCHQSPPDSYKFRYWYRERYVSPRSSHLVNLRLIDGWASIAGDTRYLGFGREGV